LAWNQEEINQLTDQQQTACQHPYQSSRPTRLRQGGSPSPQTHSPAFGKKYRPIWQRQAVSPCDGLEAQERFSDGAKCYFD